MKYRVEIINGQYVIKGNDGEGFRDLREGELPKQLRSLYVDAEYVRRNMAGDIGAMVKEFEVHEDGGLDIDGMVCAGITLELV